MVFRRTDVLPFVQGSSGSFALPFTTPFEITPGHVAVIGSIKNSRVGIQGSPSLPADFIINGNLGGEVQIRIASVSMSQVDGQILSNSLAMGETARVNALAVS